MNFAQLALYEFCSINTSFHPFGPYRCTSVHSIYFGPFNSFNLNGPPQFISTSFSPHRFISVNLGPFWSTLVHSDQFSPFKPFSLFWFTSVHSMKFSPLLSILVQFGMFLSNLAHLVHFNES